MFDWLLQKPEVKTKPSKPKKLITETYTLRGLITALDILDLEQIIQDTAKVVGENHLTLLLKIEQDVVDLAISRNVLNIDYLREKYPEQIKSVNTYNKAKNEYVVGTWVERDE